MEGMSEEKKVKKMFKNISEGKKSSFGRPRKRKCGDVKNDLKEMDVKGLKKSLGLIRLATDAEEDQGLHRSYSQWRSRNIFNH